MDPTGGLGNIFNDPRLIEKLAANPKTSSLLADSQFMASLQRVKQNPNSVGEAMRDPRFLQVMSVLLGIDMQFGAPPEGAPKEESKETKETKETKEDVPMKDSPQKAPEPEEEMPELEDENTTTKKKAKEEADKEKQIGTENYKKRQFDAAIEHYSKAWDLHKDITYLTNLGAAKFEKGDYPGAIEVCQKAIEEGREMLADFKIISK